MANNSVVVASWSTKPVRWSLVLPVQAAAASAVAAVAAVTAAALAAAVPVAAATAAALAAAAAAVAVQAAAVAVVTAVAVAATKLQKIARLTSGKQKKVLRGLFLFCASYAWASVTRGLRGRPANRRSNRALGSKRSNLATTPICHGITR
jgi:hypothetical protein